MEGLEATRYEVADGVAWLTLNRPEAANARNQRMREELEAIYDQVSTDPQVRLLVLTGAGNRFFCAGMDLKEASNEESPRQRRDRLRGSRDIEVLAALPVPTIAAVNGFALGGGFEMALACDLRIVATEAQLALPELGLGLIPGGGGTQRLPRLIGVEATYDLLYTGRRVDGPEAVQLGLATRCVPRAALRTATADLARTIASKPREALRAAKEAVRGGQELPLSAGIDQELELLLMLFAARAESNGPASPGTSPPDASGDGADPAVSSPSAGSPRASG